MSSSIGNYKGVMLCNRPFGGTGGATQQGGIDHRTGESRSFQCGLVPEAVGISVSVLGRERARIARPKKDSALTKHRKWLGELQQTKDRLELRYAEEMEARVATQKKFAERESAQRQLVRSVGTEAMEESKEGDEKQGDKGDGKQGEKGDEKQDEPETHEEERVKAVVILPSKSPTRVRGAPPLPPSKSSKPVWSMGPDEAVAKERASKEAAEEEEEQGLLAFVNDLDVDRFVGDAEVRAMMNRIKERIKVLEKEVHVETLKEAERAERAEASSESEGDEESDGDTGGEKEDGTLSAAKALLQRSARKTDDIGAVHSAKSLAVVMDRVTRLTKEEEGEVMVMREPVVCRHEANEGSRLATKALMANLPYMHRNPAV